MSDDQYDMHHVDVSEIPLIVTVNKVSSLDKLYVTTFVFCRITLSPGKVVDLYCISHFHSILYLHCISYLIIHIYPSTALLCIFIIVNGN